MTIEHLALHPGDAGYEEARTTLVGRAEPVLVLRPTTAEEVAASVRHARAERLPLAVRNGGHSFLGFCSIDGGVVLDLSRMDQVEVLEGGRVRLGGGATWGPAAAALAEHGLALTSGDTVSVGVGGLTQVGGIGWMVRKHGLALDSLLAAEVVTAAGDVVRASATEHPDLFWGLRGGAGNFGVVTALEFQAQQVTTVHFGSIAFALDDVAQLLKGWTAAMRSAPEDLTTTLALMPGFGEFPASAVLYVCLAGQDTSSLEPLRAIGTVVAEDVSERPYAQVLEEAHRPEGAPQPVLGNALVESVDEALLDAIATAYAAGGRVVMLRSLGGAFSRIDPAATAFAHRGAEAFVMSAAFLPPDATKEQVAAAHAVWRTIGEHGVGTYAGFLASDSDEDIASLWPPQTLERLRAVKRVWDPQNVFRRNFNVAP